MAADSDNPKVPPAGPGAAALRKVAHDLGNLASRLTVLSANLQAQIPDETHRAEAISLLEDTALRLKETAARLREGERGV